MTELKPKPGSSKPKLDKEKPTEKTPPPEAKGISTVIAQANQNEQELMGWQPYELDYLAQDLILDYRDKDNVLNETHKMRMTVTYGLERFWGEHLRLLKMSESNKSAYWKKVWTKLASILIKAGVELPNDPVDSNETGDIRDMAKKIWSMPIDEQRIALMVLTQFCDCLVWWKQRYDRGKNSN